MLKMLTVLVSSPSSSAAVTSQKPCRKRVYLSLCAVGVSVATGVLKISRDFLIEKKNKKKQIKKPTSNLQIPPKLTPKCCIILH